jgi:signal peptidase I
MSPPGGRPDDRGDASTPGGDRGPRRERRSARHLASGSAAATNTRNATGTDGVRGDGPGYDDRHDDGRDDAAPAHGRRRKHSVGRTVLEWVAVIGCGVLIALTAQAFLVQAFWIPSPSMEPTLEVGDRVLVNKLSYRTHEVNHGDLVVFERPPEASNGEDGEIKDLIKRVVAVGGDTIEGRDGDVYVNGERIEEPYLVEGMPTNNLPRQEVPEGTVFVMGDNRSNSEDSRVFGAIDEDTIVGRAFVKVLPLSDLGWL